MNNKLQFNLEPAINPYPQTEDRWGSLSILLLMGDEKIPLLQTEWNLTELVEWFVENKEYLRSETLSIQGELLPLPEESLSQCLKRLQERDFIENEENVEEEWFDALFNFRQHHALRFALRGASIPNIIIGYNHSRGEISLSTEEGEWCYPFDMDRFISDFSSAVSLWS